MTKLDARKQIQSLLKTIEPGDFQAKSITACNNLCQLPEFGDASVVMMFLSMAGEIDIDPAILVALERGKSVLVPNIDWNENRIIPVRLDRLCRDMPVDRYGIRYPKDAVAVDCSKIDLVVVPGLGFDRMGRRLGRGGGYYDRFLGRDDIGGLTCGIAMEEQVLDKVPIDDHDIPLDMLVTDKAIRHFSTIT
ncbi:MAG: 5-formyltetrahydrofolate cyclo-ligase [Phycisphaerae bacterium]|nr:5-formyltetrahydrofolate cyclo-ligase [Phycisphaerae bacterium]